MKHLGLLRSQVLNKYQYSSFVFFFPYLISYGKTKSSLRTVGCIEERITERLGGEQQVHN